MLQEPDVVRHAVQALGPGAQGVQDAAVRLPGVGLAADVEAAIKTEIRRETAVHFIDLPLVPVEQLQKAGFGARGAPAAQEPDIVDGKVDLFQIGYQVLHP